MIKKALTSLGFNFIPAQYLPPEKNEYYLRNTQNKKEVKYRALKEDETLLLQQNGSTSDDWNNVKVSDGFNADLVKNCRFFGLVRIGSLKPVFLEHSDMRFAVGLYNSTIISCDFGNDVVIRDVGYISHIIVGNEVIISNVNELATTNYAKFGNGILKDGEDESIRIWLELCNENGNRSVIPFSGMLPADAFLWSKYRDDETLMQKFKEFTSQNFTSQRGYYGSIGDRTIIKNCFSLKDVYIETDAYIKGATKLKNLTIHSSPDAKTQIGEGCELVNGIINAGCRIFYGVKAVRFILASNSQLKYGARLINSYLGDNSTISCCEVLNSLIFPAHEQHHNNSFLCAALVMGQSNIAAGATIGSNHNSRGADGELVAERGFWPGLCVSLKHNSRFAAFTMLAKGDYPYEMNITIPFSLVSMDVANNQLLVMPAYWFLYNMYALERNSWKYADRDKRLDKIQYPEYDYLAPDTINEMFSSLQLFSEYTGKAYLQKKETTKSGKETDSVREGKKLLEEKDSIISELEISGENFENAKRKTILIKVQEAYDIFKEMILYYGVTNLLQLIHENNISDIKELSAVIPEETDRKEWLNVGGQLFLQEDVSKLRQMINQNKIQSWQEIHAFYDEKGKEYSAGKMHHAIASLNEIANVDLKNITVEKLNELMLEAVSIKEKMTNAIFQSRKKDYTNPFRKLTYDNEKEMESVVGKLSDNTFINHKKEELQTFVDNVHAVQKKFSAKKELSGSA